MESSQEPLLCAASEPTLPPSHLSGGSQEVWPPPHQSPLWAPPFMRTFGESSYLLITFLLKRQKVCFLLRKITCTGIPAGQYLEAVFRV